MFVVPILVLLLTGVTVHGERHSLTYIYTALSKPVGLPGIHEFSAMGLLDGKMIDYFDSQNRTIVVKQDWMKGELPAEFWETRMELLWRKEQWLKDNIKILMKQMRQNESDIHDLRSMYGCEATVQANKSLSFIRGMDIYSYDGDDSLTFDRTNRVWVITNSMTEPTNSQGLQDDLLYEECMGRLDVFRRYGQKQLQVASRPEVFMFASKSKVETNLVLTCLVTGFDSKDIKLIIRRDDRVLTKDDGVESSGVRPNEDDTFQIRDHVEVLRSDKSTFTCRVVHAATSVNVERVWDHSLPDGPGGVIGGVIAGVVVGLLLFVVGVGVVLLVLWKRRNQGPAANGAAANGAAVTVPLSPAVNGAAANGAAANGAAANGAAANGAAANGAAVMVSMNDPADEEEIQPLSGSRGPGVPAAGDRSNGWFRSENTTLETEL